jgi:hypothetical protein
MKRSAVIFAMILFLSSFSILSLPVKAVIEVQTVSALDLVVPDWPYVGVNMAVVVNMMVSPPPPAATDQLHGLKVKIVRPDGSLENHSIIAPGGQATFNYFGPYTTDSNGTAFFQYVPTTVGTYMLQLQYPGEQFANGTLRYMPSDSNVKNLVVQPEPTPSPTITPKPTPTQSPNAKPPVISSVTPITAARLQTITIYGNGFGNTQPVLLNLGDGSVDTVGGGKNLPGASGTPIIQVHDDARNTWQAGVQDSPSTGCSSIGIFLDKWSDTEIVLSGFGSALSTTRGTTEWTIENGDPMWILIATPRGTTTYNTTVIPSNETQPTPTPTPKPNLPTPALAVTCQSSTTNSNFKVTISGALSSNNTGIQDASILLSTSVDIGKSWNQLTSVSTAESGAFAVAWTPLVTGSFLIKAEWAGNSEYSAVQTTVNLIVTPFEEQHTFFSVASNSTVSAFAFNSTSRELSFTVTGASGTTGYIDMYVPKSLVSDVSSLKVYLDGSQLTYTSESQGDSWRIVFGYHHSTHQVAVTLGSLLPSLPNQTSLEQWIAYAAVTAAIVAIVLFAVIKRRKKQN